MLSMEPRPFLIFDEHRNVCAASPNCHALLGKAPEALVGMRCRDAFDCAECSGEACPLQQAIAGEQSEGLLPRSERARPLEVSSSPIMGKYGEMALLHLRAPAAEPVSMGAGLQPVLDSVRELLAGDLAALAFYDDTFKEIRWQVTSGQVSPGVTSIRLRPGQGFAGRIVLTELPLRTFRFPQDLTGDPGSYPIFLAEGLQSALGVPVKAKGRVMGVLMIASRCPRDYSQEEEATLAQVADSIALAAELMCLHEAALRAERARLAQEVHDGLSQNMFGLKLLLSDLQSHLLSDAPENTEKNLGVICRLLDTTLTEVRRLISDLRGSVQPNVGLVSGLSDYLAQFYRMTNLPVELAVRLAPGEEILTSDTHGALRIVQEALMNIYRHAGANRVWVEVARMDGAYRLTISDDGKGFDPSLKAPSGHYGLTIMKERAESLGAQLSVESAPAKGTSVNLLLPV